MIGTDIIEIKRIEKAMKIDRFRKKVFTEAELLLIEKKGVHSAAANFAGKEAIAKALGTGIRGFRMVDIEILRNDLGAPYVLLHNKAKELADNYNATDIRISLSHCKSYAVAFVVMENKKI